MEMSKERIDEILSVTGKNPNDMHIHPDVLEDIVTEHISIESTAMKLGKWKGKPVEEQHQLFLERVRKRQDELGYVKVSDFYTGVGASVDTMLFKDYFEGKFEEVMPEYHKELEDAFYDLGIDSYAALLQYRIPKDLMAVTLQIVTEAEEEIKKIRAWYEQRTPSVEADDIDDMELSLSGDERSFREVFKDTTLKIVDFMGSRIAQAKADATLSKYFRALSEESTIGYEAFRLYHDGYHSPGADDMVNKIFESLGIE